MWFVKGAVPRPDGRWSHLAGTGALADAMVSLAESELRILVDELDRDPWLLCWPWALC